MSDIVWSGRQSAEPGHQLWQGSYGLPDSQLHGMYPILVRPPQYRCTCSKCQGSGMEARFYAQTTCYPRGRLDDTVSSPLRVRNRTLLLSQEQVLRTRDDDNTRLETG